MLGTTIRYAGRKYAVAPVGYSGMRCPRCKMFFTAEEMRKPNDPAQFWGTRCKHCFYFVIDTPDYSFGLLQSALPFLKPRAVREASRFHATNVRDWHAGLLRTTLNKDEHGRDQSVLVHLGTYEAAMQRAQDEFLLDPNQKWYLHEVKLNPTAKIAKRIAEDSDSNAPYEAYQCDEKNHLSYGITRYLNSYESPGSISLLIHPTLFEVIKSTPMTVADIKAHVPSMV